MTRAGLVPARSATSAMRVSQRPRSQITATAASRIGRRRAAESCRRGLMVLPVGSGLAGAGTPFKLNGPRPPRLQGPPDGPLRPGLAGPALAAHPRHDAARNHDELARWTLWSCPAGCRPGGTELGGG